MMVKSSRVANAGLAVDVYVHRIVQTIGAMAATLGGIDALVFTAGVGERAVEIRKRVCEKLKYLGLELDRPLTKLANRTLTSPGQPQLCVSLSSGCLEVPTELGAYPKRCLRRRANPIRSSEPNARRHEQHDVPQF
jgi:hypothetical protein